jgi:hypothetical protein
MTKSDQSQVPRWRRIGFANVIAFIALFVALGGGAYAASSIGTSDLKNKSVTTKKLDKKAVTGSKLAKGAVKKNKIKDESVTSSKLNDGAVTDSKLSDDSKSRWAVVSTNGTLDRGKGVVSSARFGAGAYEVIFDRDVTECSWVASIGAGDTTDIPRGFLRTALRGNNTSGVFVGTYDTGNAASDRAFHLRLSC